jgi:hypothetical protein
VRLEDSADDIQNKLLQRNHDEPAKQRNNDSIINQNTIPSTFAVYY